MNLQDLNNRDFFESRERFAMNQLFLLHIKPVFEPLFDTTLYLTSTYREKTLNAMCFDAIIYLRNKVTMDIVHKYIIEIKYRDSDFDTIMLEKKKYTDLMKEYKKATQYDKDIDVTILYINFLPSGTYIFNMNGNKVTDFIKNNKNKVKKKLVKTTYIQDDAIVNKTIYYLPKTIAKRFPLIITKDYHLTYQLKDKLQPIKEVKQTIKTYSIF